jgi:hypothetical protein
VKTIREPGTSFFSLRGDTVNQVQMKERRKKGSCKYLAIQQRHDILMMNFGELLKKNITKSS